MSLELAVGVRLKNLYKKQMTSFTILNNLYLAKDAPKYSEGGPDLLSGHLFELGAGCRGQIRKVIRIKLLLILSLTTCILHGMLYSKQKGLQT